MKQAPDDRERLSEETARKLLERAASIDDTRLSLAQLREAAAEAGISNAAFDAAVGEWRRAAGDARSKPAAPNRLTSLLPNCAALAGGWISVSTLALVVRLTGAPWLVHKLTDPIGLAIGALIAAKSKARPAAIVLAGLTVSQLAEFLMDLFAGAPTIHGFGAHMALMIAGVLGVALGHRLLRPSSQARPPTANGYESAGDIENVEASPEKPSRVPTTDADVKFIRRLLLSPAAPR
jgi:hypothetical protein